MKETFVNDILTLSLDKEDVIIIIIYSNEQNGIVLVDMFTKVQTGS